MLHGFEGTSNSDAPRSRQLLLHLEFSNPEGVSDEDEPETLQLKFLGMPDEELQTLFDEVTNCTNLSDGINGGDYMDNGEGGDSRIIFEGSVGYDGMGGLPASQAGVSVRDFVSAISWHNHTRDGATFESYHMGSKANSDCRPLILLYRLHSLAVAVGLLQRTLTSFLTQMETSSTGHWVTVQVESEGMMRLTGKVSMAILTSTIINGPGRNDRAIFAL